jgi:hypothetical protein
MALPSVMEAVPREERWDTGAPSARSRSTGSPCISSLCSGVGPLQAVVVDMSAPFLMKRKAGLPRVNGRLWEREVGGVGGRRQGVVRWYRGTVWVSCYLEGYSR